MANKLKLKNGLVNLKNEKLLNKNFLIVVIGQLISIFANAVLRFVLPLYILDKTGSTAVFGSILAVAAVPPIFFSPLGGILADRFNRKNIMVILDFITASVIALFAYLLLESSAVISITFLMIIFAMIQAIYQPAVQASIPLITAEENLEQANGIISLVNAASNLLGPAAAGILYGYFSVQQIMFISVIFFAGAAVMEIFISMKFKREKVEGSISSIIKSDLQLSLNYILEEKPIMLKAMLITSGMNLFLTSMILVGLPAMIKIRLGLSSQHYGYAEALMAAGMIAGGILISSLKDKMRAEDSYKMLVYSSLALMPIALAFFFNLTAMNIYYIIILSCFSMMVFITIFSITMMSFVQRETPDHLIGKVISYILVLTQLTLPIGQAVYGIIFDKMISSLSLVVMLTGICSLVVALYSKTAFSRLEREERAVLAKMS